MPNQTLEKDRNRFVELLNLGFDNLDAAQKEEYSTLLEMYPEFKDIVFSEPEELEKKKEEKEPKKEEEKTAKKTTSGKVGKAKPEVLKEEPEYRSYFMVSNVCHDGVDYVKDQEIQVSSPVFETFKQKGFLIKK